MASSASASASSASSSSSPAGDLMSSVPEKFWAERWDKGQIGWHRDQVNDDLRHYSNLFQQHFNITHGDSTADKVHRCRVLVPLCGKSLDLLHLYQEGYDVIGVEYVDKAILDFFTEQSSTFSSYQRKKLSDNMELFSSQDGRLQILRSDFFDPQVINVIGPVDYCWDRAALIAIGHAAETRRKYVAQLYRILQQHSFSTISSSSASSATAGAGGPHTSNGVLLPHILLETFCYDQNLDIGPPFSQSDEQIRNLFSNVVEDIQKNNKEFPLAIGENFKQLKGKLKQIELISTENTKKKVYIQLLSDYQFSDEIRRRFNGPTYIRVYSIQFV